LAQILAQQAGFPIACELISWRVQRLVVSPLLQGQGIGSSLVQHVYGLAKATQVDFVGASFSASTDSLRFWQRNHFQPAWLGLRADTATGLNSVQVMQAISLEAKQLAQHLSCHLRDYLAFGQHLWFAAVDAQTWQHLAAAAPSATATMLDFQQQQRLLSLLAKGHAGFSGPLYLLYQQLHDQKHQQMVIYAAQHNTHRGLQRGVRQLALSLITSTDEQ
jgi:tRNA(Met) C34 N-acetyltransferase TmcA